MRRLQKENNSKGKLHMCFSDLEKDLNRVPRKMLEEAMRRK